MKIILATSNPSKAEQIKAALEGIQASILTSKEAGIEGEAVEDGITLEENALKKAWFTLNRASDGSWAMADDTGLFIDALDDKPGIKAARWAGEKATTEEIMNYCLERLKGKESRRAAFKTVIALVSPDGKEHIFSGEVRGTILEHPRCAPQPKMPYSALFMPDGSNLVWGQMTVEQENLVSHRGIALRKLAEFLKNI